jgi:hypothetical protein
MFVLPEPRVIESPKGMILTGDRQARGSWVGVGVGVRVGVNVWVGVEVWVGVWVDVGVGVNVLEGSGVKLATAVRVTVIGRPVAEGAGPVPVGLAPV